MRPRGQVRVRHGWCRLRAGEGHRGRLARSTPEGARPLRLGPEVRPVPERRSGDDEPVPARRGVRDRGRRRDRPRHRPLRALHRREPLAQREPHGRRDLGLRSCARSARASSSARPCRSSRTSRTRSRRGSGAPRRCRPPTSSSPRSAGTVGDIESLPFLEAIRQFRREVGPENVVYLHVTLVPFLDAAGELKTKPTQHSVNELRRIGIHPDVVVCRSTEPLSDDIREKIALFADVDRRAVIGSPGRPRRLPHPGGAAGRGARHARLREARARGAAPPSSASGRELIERTRELARGRRDRARRQVREAPRCVPLRARGAQARGRPRGVPRPRALGRRREHVVRGGRPRARAGGRRARPGRVRLARVGGEDPRLPGRARAGDPVPRHLPRHARRRVRVRSSRLRDGRRQLDGDGSRRRRSP